MLSQFTENFEYKADHKRWDSWRVLKPDHDGKYRGDCDDAAITMLYFLVGESYLKLLWALVFSRYKIVYVTGSGDFAHAMLQDGDEYIDNIFKAWGSKKFYSTNGYKFHSWLFPWPVAFIKLALGFIK